ncbi:hypothetical protein AXG93_2139s1000 [Marchantia polymorpha subsp. ruderalis]|uniref:DUF659 domain-containing protein n=1 Tax=Marchantia polymorpha subsp. ruderalis TaxID=1480154 RepID=A0A176WK68_MARPO|nr:hypothetical protein AXG93_2139s1000 [Marchantia polymorpha subsp. ruderalis]
MAAAQNESLELANANASHGIWEHFTKTLHKINTAHYGAICNGWAAKGLKAVTLILDSWTNVKREQLLGFTVATANRNVFALYVVDVTRDRKIGDLLAIEILKATTELQEKFDAKALQVLVWFTSQSVPSARLQEKLVAVEGKTMALILLAITRWGSHLKSISRLLQIACGKFFKAKTQTVEVQRAMKLLMLEPKAELVASVGNSTASKRKAEAVLDIIKELSFWKMLHQFGEYKTHKGDFSLVNAYACEEYSMGFWEVMQDVKP